jgi:hypothetical protein
MMSSNIKAPSAEFCAATNGKHPQGWTTSANTTEYHGTVFCRSSWREQRRSHAACARHPTPTLIACRTTCVCISITAKSCSGTTHRSVNTSTVVDTSVDIAGPVFRRPIITQSNTSLDNEPNAVFLGVCVASPGRLVLFWPRFTGAVGGCSQLAGRACGYIVAAACFGNTERSFWIRRRIYV